MVLKRQSFPLSLSLHVAFRVLLFPLKLSLALYAYLDDYRVKWVRHGCFSFFLVLVMAHTNIALCCVRTEICSGLGVRALTWKSRGTIKQVLQVSLSDLVPLSVIKRTSVLTFWKVRSDNGATAQEFLLGLLFIHFFFSQRTFVAGSPKGFLSVIFTSS